MTQRDSLSRHFMGFAEERIQVAYLMVRNAPGYREADAEKEDTHDKLMEHLNTVEGKAAFEKYNSATNLREGEMLTAVYRQGLLDGMRLATCETLGIYEPENKEDAEPARVPASPRGSA